MHEGLGRPQVEELRQLRSRVAKLERNDARREDIKEAYRILVDHSLQGLVLLQEERIVFANQAAADITGYGPEELLTITLEQALGVIHPEDRPMVRQRHEDRLKGRPVPARYELRVTHRDGSLRWLEIHAGVIEYRGRPAIRIALTDLTERKRVEETLNLHRHLQNVHSGWSPFAAIAITTLAALAISIHFLSSGWVIIFQNLLYVPIVIACTYYAKKGFAFSVVLSFIYLFLVIALTGDAAVILQALIGILIFVGVAGVITFLSTKRKQIEDELRQVAEEAKQLKQKIEFILGATNTGLDIIDPELHIRYIDPEWQKVYGDPRGRKCHEYFMGRSDACPDCGALKAIAAKQVTVTENVLPKQGNRPIQVTSIPFQDQEGDWLVAEINVDITERKQAEESLRVSEE
ncbi:MAG: PAS domain S-box protein [Phycisphaerae bacterium]|nr:PAS domain S-box protein [Phycisphaerae bacterium]